MKPGAFFLILGLAWAPGVVGKNYYADNNRDLFLLPRSAAVGSSDFVFNRDGANQSNPANVTSDSSSDISLAYAGFFQNTFSSSILSYVTPVSNNSGIGISFGYISIPDIEYTENLTTMIDGSIEVPVYDPSRIRYVTASEMYLHFAYGYKHLIRRGIEAAAGMAINAQRVNLPPYRGYGIGFDGGAAVDFTKIGLKIALGCENITTNYTRWSREFGETDLPHLRFGIGWRKEIPSLYGRIQIQHKSLDLFSNEGINSEVEESAADNSSSSLKKPAIRYFSKDPLYFLLSGAYGVEYTVMNALALRMGILSGDDYGEGTKIAFGCGINLLKKKLAFDISYLTHELAGTYLLGVTYRWRNDMINKGR